MSPDVPHHAYDRAMRDAWRRWPADLVEGLLGRRLSGGVTAQATYLERGPLEVDALYTDADGTPIQVEFQTRADRTLGFRMFRYFGALDSLSGPPPEQHVVLLHPDAEFPGIGTYRRGNLVELRYDVHRLWHMDPDALLARDGLLRLVPISRARNDGHRVELLARAARAIIERLSPGDRTDNLYWTANLATLYLDRDVISATLEDLRMPIDLSHTNFARELRAEEALATRRADVRRIVVARFGDESLGERVASAPESVLEDAIDLVATAKDPAEITAWLKIHDS